MFEAGLHFPSGKRMRRHRLAEPGRTSASKAKPEAQSAALDRIAAGLDARIMDTLDALAMPIASMPMGGERCAATALAPHREGRVVIVQV